MSLVLLRGPSENVKPLSTIVEGIPNSGQYSWTPSTSLEDDVTHYGLQLIEDATGYFQYSTQFGISNKNPKSETPAPETPAPEDPAVKDDTATPDPVTEGHAAEEDPKDTPKDTPTYGTPVNPKEPTVVYTTHIATVTDCNCGSKPTGSMPVYNSTNPGYSAPASPDNTATEPPVFTGAAAQFKVGSAMVAIVAAMGMVLSVLV